MWFSPKYFGHLFIYRLQCSSWYVVVVAVLCFRYSGQLLDEAEFSTAIGSTAITRDFSKLVEWIVTELAAVAKLEEHVHSVDSIYIQHYFINKWLIT